MEEKRCRRCLHVDMALRRFVAVGGEAQKDTLELVSWGYGDALTLARAVININVGHCNIFK